MPEGLDNAMAAQALFPLITPEMWVTQAMTMLAFPNELSSLVNPNTLDGADAAFDAIMQRLIGDENVEAPEGYQSSLSGHVPESISRFINQDISIVQVANALAHFEELAFATRNSRWDSHLAGDRQALTAREKRSFIVLWQRPMRRMSQRRDFQRFPIPFGGCHRRRLENRGREA